MKEYRQFVAAGGGEQPWADLVGQIYYGDEKFVTRVAKPALNPEVSRRQRQPVRPSLAQVVPTGTPEEVGRAYREYGYRLGEIAQQLGVHYSTVSR